MVAKKKNISRKRSRPIQPKKSFFNIKIIGIIIIFIIIIVSVYFIFISFDTNGENDENPIAVIDTSMGIIKVELYEDKAPNTCENFIKYVNDGFYSGLVFHRMANLNPSAPDTHIVQGGGFDGNGNYKEPTYTPIDLEIAQDLTHVDGAIAMARTTDPNSATSQFYICDGPQHFLDGDYAVFGLVIDGLDVVRSICSLDTIIKEVPAPYNTLDNWPLNDGENVDINSITIK